MARKRETLYDIPGLLCFSLNGDRNGERGGEALEERAKRARFEPERRREVAVVRAKGACLRCRLMKLPCSGARPCERCIHMAQSAFVSSYTWMACGTAAFADFKEFFLLDLEVPTTISDEKSWIAPQMIELEFEAHVKWNIEDLSKEWGRYITNEVHAPTISIVGVMSSIQLYRLLSEWIPDFICEQFRLLAYTSSLMCSLEAIGSDYGYTKQELRNINSKVGRALLESLDKLLRPSAPPKVTPEKLRALFLCLFGTIFFVSYIGSLNYIRKSYAQDAFQPTVDAKLHQLQKELICLLANTMILIADRLDLLDKSAPRALLVKSAQHKFNLPAVFTWAVNAVEGPRRTAPNLGRALKPDIRARAAKLRHFMSCATCLACDKSGIGIGGLCSHCVFSNNGCMMKQPTIDLLLSQAPSIRLKEPKVRGSPTSNSISPPRCQKCGFILPKDMNDELCYSCIGRDVENFDQGPSDTFETFFNSPPDPPYALNFNENDSDGLLNSMYAHLDDSPPGVGVGNFENVDGETSLALMSPRVIDHPPTPDDLPIRYNVPVCGYVSDHTVSMGSLLGYLV